MMALDYAAKQKFSLPIRYAVLMHDLGKGTTPKEMLPRHIGHDARSASLVKIVSKRLRAPNNCTELAYIVAKFHIKAHQVMIMKAATLLKFLIDLDAIRQPERFEAFLKACEADSRGRLGLENIVLPEAILMRKALGAAMSVDAGSIASHFDNTEAIKSAIFEARLEKVKSVI